MGQLVASDEDKQKNKTEMTILRGTTSKKSSRECCRKIKWYRVCHWAKERRGVRLSNAPAAMQLRAETLPQCGTTREEGSRGLPSLFLSLTCSTCTSTSSLFYLLLLLFLFRSSLSFRLPFYTVGRCSGGGGGGGYLCAALCIYNLYLL